MRVKGGNVTHLRRKKILKQAKGYFGSKHLLFKTAKEQVMRSHAYSYVDRRNLKRDYRKLWIKRINAACRIILTSAQVSVIPPSEMRVYPKIWLA